MQTNYMLYSLQQRTFIKQFITLCLSAFNCLPDRLLGFVTITYSPHTEDMNESTQSKAMVYHFYTYNLLISNFLNV
jgi:hypothetical protein